MTKQLIFNAVTFYITLKLIQTEKFILITHK